MNVVAVTDSDQQSSGKSGKFKFDDCALWTSEEFERIQFDVPTRSEPLLYRETVMIHSCGLLLCGQNRYVRHWLDVFLRDKVPQRTAVELNYGQDLMLHMHVSQWSRSFMITKDNLFEWVEPPDRAAGHLPLLVPEKRQCHHHHTGRLLRQMYRTSKPHPLRI